MIAAADTFPTLAMKYERDHKVGRRVDASDAAWAGVGVSLTRTTFFTPHLCAAQGHLAHGRTKPLTVCEMTQFLPALKDRASLLDQR